MSDKRPQTIFRIAYTHKPYAQLSNDMLQDRRLSLEARGFLGSVMSRPTNWQFNLAWMEEEHGIGREKARRIMGECIEHGYCLRRRLHDPRGRLSGTEYVFTDDPILLKKQEPHLETADPSLGVHLVTGFTYVGKTPTQGKTAPTKERSIITKKEDQRSFELRSNDPARRPAQLPRFVSETALEKVRALAPGWDRQALLRKFLNWPGSKNARNMDAAFLAWVPKFTKGRMPA